ncbi:MAG: hypothetical protein AAB462_02600 [Patescibacteria group bacterium]
MTPIVNIEIDKRQYAVEVPEERPFTEVLEVGKHTVHIYTSNKPEHDDGIAFRVLHTELEQKGEGLMTRLRSVPDAISKVAKYMVHGD